MAAIPVAHAGGQRHRHLRRPHGLALRARKPCRRVLRRQPRTHPGQHVVEAAADAAGGLHRGPAHLHAVGAHRHVAPVAPHVRLGDVTDLVAAPVADLAALHAQRLEDFAAHERFVGRTTRHGGDFARDDVEQVVVGVARAEAVGGFEVREPLDDVGAAEVVRLRPEHQVAGAGGQAAVVDQQVAHLHLARHPRILHAELRQVTLYRVVPLELSGVHQARERGRGHRLGVGGDLEQRLRIDRLTAAGGQFACGARVDDLAVLDDADRETRQAVALHRGVEGGIDRRIGRVRRERQQQGQQQAQARLHASLQAVGNCSLAIICAKLCRRRTTA